MLQELTITDFAIIQQIRLHLSQGLVIFTGETGAGKSIVLDAIGALLGDRLGADVVRAGAARAVVEGIFVLPWLPAALSDVVATATARVTDEDDEAATQEQEQEQDGQQLGADHPPEPRRALARLLHEHGLATADGSLPGEETLIITREIAQSGRTTARVNGRAVPIAVLSRIGALLVDVHGQGAHLELLRSEQHINYLDRYGDLLSQRAELSDAVRAWQGLKRAERRLRGDERELERRAELLRYQVDEIDTADLQPHEVEDLERERRLLANAEQLREQSTAAYAAFNGDDEGETPGALSILAKAQHLLRDLIRLDPDLTETQAALDDAIYRLEDVSATLRDERERAEADPERLAEIEERLALIGRLRRKYGAGIPEILAFADEARAELAGIEHRDERLAEIVAHIERDRATLGALAADLSRRRQMAAERMSAAMEAALETLHMRRARFVVATTTHEHPDGVPVDGPADTAKTGVADGPLPGTRRIAISPTGIDRVEFLIAPNPGEPPRPLARIASGGETARLMLALKSILAAADTTPTLIFDEVDSGISGLTGQIVGEMLWRLARAHQVICVTHLPQMAAFADQHWHVAKLVQDDRTTTVVTDLDAAQRTLELAQMLGGVATETAARNAAELLDRADQMKVSPAPPDPPAALAPQSLDVVQPKSAATNGHAPHPAARRTGRSRP